MTIKRLVLPLLILLILFGSACNLTNLLPGAVTATLIPTDTPPSTSTFIDTPTTVLTVTSSLTTTDVPTDTPTPTHTISPTPPYSYVQGILWHDVCRFTGGEAGEPVVLGQGCVQWGEETYQFGPNQVYDAFETGWSGVTLHIGAGACPSTGFGTAVTNASGAYGFYVLSPGTYCISYSPLTDGNDTILIPGGATFPERGNAGYSRNVTVEAGVNQTGINFGYAFQFFN